MALTRTPVHRITPSASAEHVPAEPGFACAYAMDVEAADARSPEQWARAVWEGSPAPLRWFMLAGWRFGLGLRLGARQSPDHVLGWPIVERFPDSIVCAADSPVLSAYNAFRRDDGQLVWSTFVYYRRPIARLIWPLAAVVHRPLVRRALRRAR
jgi:hypothetical protein